MDPQQTASHYNQLARHWAGPDFIRQNGIRQHERALLFLREGKTAIDVGCGSSGRIIELLLARGFAVEGLDISAEMLRLAREKHPQVVFHQADICTWDFPKTYDFISAWDSIWHVPLAQHEMILEKLCRALNPGGVLVFTSGGTDEPGEVTAPFQEQPLYHAAPGIPNLLRWLDRLGGICRHLEYDQFPEGHLYLIVQKSKTTQKGTP